MSVFLCALWIFVGSRRTSLISQSLSYKSDKFCEPRHTHTHVALSTWDLLDVPHADARIAWHRRPGDISCITKRTNQSRPNLKLNSKKPTPTEDEKKMTAVILVKHRRYKQWTMNNEQWTHLYCLILHRNVSSLQHSGTLQNQNGWIKRTTLTDVTLTEDWINSKSQIKNSDENN
jgi:hypothetical protein